MAGFFDVFLFYSAKMIYFAVIFQRAIVLRHPTTGSVLNF